MRKYGFREIRHVDHSTSISVKLMALSTWLNGINSTEIEALWFYCAIFLNMLQLFVFTKFPLNLMTKI